MPCSAFQALVDYTGRMTRPRQVDACACCRAIISASAMQVDYASAALFLNISAHVSGASEVQVAWWQHPELRMKDGLDPRTQARAPPAQASLQDPALLPSAPLGCCMCVCVGFLSLLRLGCPGASRVAFHILMSIGCALLLVLAVWPDVIPSVSAGCGQIQPGMVVCRRARNGDHSPAEAGGCPAVSETGDHDSSLP